jgi:hypothetical protein
MRRTLVLCVVTGLMLTLNSVWAEDVNPPPWSRTDAGTTLQWWEFSTDANPTDPEPGYNNTAGVPQVSLTGGFIENTVWWDIYQGHEGVWCFEEEMIASIPNFEQLNPVKEIWLQLTYWSDGIPNILALPEGQSSELVVMTLENNTPLGDDWYQATWSALLEPNPLFEELWIRPAHCTLYVDELVVDTICTVPEPATICLLGLGALALLRRRRG